MPINKCRVCGGKFFSSPLLVYNNMPKAAQHLPDAGELENEKGIYLTLCECSSCGLVQLDSEPVAYYKDVIRAAAFSEEMRNFRTNQFNEFVEKYSLHGKKVIETACGRGEYLSIMEQCDVDAYGIENLDESVAYCIKNKLKVSKNFIDNADCVLENAPFDAFFILNFLEHLPDPNSLLRGICNNLSEGAVGLVEVPNFDMILRNKLFSEFIGDHLFYFTQKTLSMLLELNGFEIVECKEIWYDYIISAVVRKRKVIDVSELYDYQHKVKNEINRYIDRFGKKEVAIWGAGHQALAVIALSALDEKIKYVIDSAPFKQNKYTPATHIKIVAPETIEQQPVKAIIVMAASYSDEVAKIIHRQYDKNIKIAILRDYGLEIL